MSYREAVKQLTEYEEFEAEIAAFEASKLFNFISGRAEAGRNIHVAANNSYGSLLAVEPLEDYLKELGIPVSYHYIHSTNARKSDMSEIFGPELIRRFLIEAPDVVIVDGTTSSFIGQPDNLLTRYPKSMYRYLNWFLIFNDGLGELPKLNKHLELLSREVGFKQLNSSLRDSRKQYSPQTSSNYLLSFYSPTPTNWATIGSADLSTPFRNPDLTNPELILANPVTDPRRIDYPITNPTAYHHIPAYFDDLKNKTSPTDDVHSIPNNNLRCRSVGQLTSLVQNHIKTTLPKFI